MMLVTLVGHEPAGQRVDRHTAEALRPRGLHSAVLVAALLLLLMHLHREVVGLVAPPSAHPVIAVVDVATTSETATATTAARGAAVAPTITIEARISEWRDVVGMPHLM